MRLEQFLSHAGERRVGRVSDDGRGVQVLYGVGTTYQLAQQAARERRSLADLAAAAGDSENLELSGLLADGRVLAPLDHPDPAHCASAGLTGKWPSAFSMRRAPWLATIMLKVGRA
jgi:hypothetical protein